MVTNVLNASTGKLDLMILMIQENVDDIPQPRLMMVKALSPKRIKMMAVASGSRYQPSTSHQVQYADKEIGNIALPNVVL
jgi:hypothetical protein